MTEKLKTILLLKILNSFLNNIKIVRKVCENFFSNFVDIVK